MKSIPKRSGGGPSKTKRRRQEKGQKKTRKDIASKGENESCREGLDQKKLRGDRSWESGGGFWERIQLGE